MYCNIGGAGIPVSHFSTFQQDYIEGIVEFFIKRGEEFGLNLAALDNVCQSEDRRPLKEGGMKAFLQKVHQHIRDSASSA